MKISHISLSVILTLLAASCGNQTGNEGDSISTIDSESMGASNEDAISDLGMLPDQLSYAESTISNLYDSSAKFDEKDQTIETTPVEGRFKITGSFTRGDGPKEYYEIYVQKFDEQWEFGTLIISPDQNPNLSNASFVSTGKMKEMEQAQMNKQEEGTLGNIQYTIIKRNAPNYITIYTPKKLTPQEVKAVYNEFKDSYESILLTDKNDPDSNEYIRIDRQTVWDFTKGTTTNINNYN